MSIGCATILALAGQAALARTYASSELTGVTVQHVGPGIEVDIKGIGLQQPKIIRIGHGRTYFLQFNASMKGRPQHFSVHEAGVNTVRSSWYRARPAIVRVRLELDKNVEPSVESSTDGWHVLVNVAKQGTPVKAYAESYPSEVPPLEPKLTPTENHAAQPIVLVNPVSLDFNNTEIVQILRALALQANVNIVTSPDVKGSLTVSLNKVSLQHALDVVTGLAGLRYATVEGTIVVAKAENLSDALYSITGKKATAQTSNVVPSAPEMKVVELYSGQGQAIKASISHIVPATTQEGSYEILLPSDSSLTKIAKPATGANLGTPVLPDQTGIASPQTAPGTSQNPLDAIARSLPPTGGGPAPADPKASGNSDLYLVLCGSPERIQALLPIVKELDKEICLATGRDHPDIAGEIAHDYYEPQGTSVEGLLQSIGLSGPAAQYTQGLLNTGGKLEGVIGSVHVAATAPDSNGRPRIILTGRRFEVAQVKRTLQELDRVNGDADIIKVLDVKFADPVVLQDDLRHNFPSLRIVIPPTQAGSMRINQDRYQNGLDQIVKDQYKVGPRSTAGTSGTSSGSGTSSSSTSTSTPSSGTSSSSSSSGGSGSSSTSGMGSAPQNYQQFEQMAIPMRLVLRGDPALVEKALSYVSQIDLPPKQVAIEFRVVELSKDDALKAGINWSMLTSGSLKLFNLNNSNPITPSNTGTVSISGKNLSGDVTGSLDSTLNHSKIIARPNLLVSDGREANVFIGDNVQYIQSIQSTQNGVTIQTGQQNVGISLDVLPRIGGDDNVALELTASVSSIKSWLPVPNGGQLPQTSYRTTQMPLSLRSGETLAIGGLITDQDVRNVQGFPLLMNLPIVGQLFRSTSNEHIRTEIVMFVTVKSVEGPNHPTPNVLPMQDTKTEISKVKPQ